MNGTKVKFGDLNVGDYFSLSNKASGMEYLNIKVSPSILKEYIGKDNYFNAIACADGRVRTFHKDESVYLYDKLLIFVMKIEDESNIDIELIAKSYGLWKATDNMLTDAEFEYNRKLINQHFSIL